jgi:sugar lactone lactonase YvrE
MKLRSSIGRLVFCGVLLGSTWSLSAVDDVITSVVGGGTVNGKGDGGLAIHTTYNICLRVVVDQDNNVYFSEQNSSRVRRVDAVTGIVTTYAGNGVAGVSGVGGPATAANISRPCGLALDATGNLYITDRGDPNGLGPPHRICRVDRTTGILTVVAGGSAGFGGDEGPATAANFMWPSGIAIGPSGAIYIADQFNHRIRKFTVGGNIATIAGTGTAGFSGDGSDATSAQLNQPNGVAVDADERVYIADEFNHCVRRIDTDGTISTVVGVGGTSGFTLENPSGTVPGSTLINQTGDVAIGTNGELHYVDVGARRIRKISGGMVTTVAGGGPPFYLGDGGPAKHAFLGQHWSVALARDGSHDVVFADWGHQRVRRVTKATGMIATIAGGGGVNDGHPALESVLARPTDVAVDSAGNRFIADRTAHRIRRVDKVTGNVTTVVGNGRGAFGGDDRQAADASINAPYSLAITSDDVLYFSDSGNHRVRGVDLKTGIITTIAGDGTSGFNGDGVATAVHLSTPRGLAVDGVDGLYVVDAGVFRLRRIDLGSGQITTVAGTGTDATTGDDGPATAAALAAPLDVAVAQDGTVFITGTTTRRIGTDDQITSVPGSLVGTGIAVDEEDALYVADALSHRIARLESGATTPEWIAGNGAAGLSGDDGLPTLASLDTPTGLFIDQDGRLLIADQGNARIRQVEFAPPPTPPPGPGSGGNSGSSGGGGCGIGGGAATWLFMLLACAVVGFRRLRTAGGAR